MWLHRSPGRHSTTPQDGAHSLRLSKWVRIQTQLMSVPGYGLDDRDSRVRLPAGAGDFSVHHRVQNGSGAHPDSSPMGSRGSFSGSKVARE
jgi:hypothetical protein